MRVLVISRNAWDNTNSIGNTLSNFFGSTEGIELANIYFRSSQPNNSICTRYYHVTEKDIIKYWFFPEKLGEQFVRSDNKIINAANRTEIREKSLIRFVKRYKFKLAYKLSDMLWNGKKWINRNFTAFIESFAPDIVFSFVKSAPQYFLTIQYLREKFRIPLVTWIADDEYTGLYQKNKKREIRNLKYILDESAIVAGCSLEICEYYRSVFGCRAFPLYKGCDLSVPVKDYVNTPLKIVYAGNLLYGRMEIIRNVAKVLGDYDPTGEKILFEIYSNTPISPAEERHIDKKPSVQYLGCLDYETIKQRLSSADVVLHVESFEAEQVLKTKYSFSTKIIDYLQSGGVLLAIGPEELASIAYIKQIPGACVIDSLENMKVELIDFLTDRASFIQRSKAIRDFAQRYHDAVTNAKELKIVLERVMEVVS